MAQPVVQFTRLTNAGRLSDRFLACQVREFYGAGFDGQARLFVLVEIVRPWLAASQIGQALLHAFTSAYQDAVSIRDDLKHVEAALKRVNETLVHLAQQGENEWIGHLNAVFMLEKAGLVHVAQTGRAAAYLWRDGRLSRITEHEAPQSAATASRTFANITSGTLEVEDSVVIGSAEFFQSITADLLEETLRNATPAEAAARYARILRQHQSRGAAAMVLRTYDPRVLEQQPLLTDPEVIYLDEQPIETLGSTLRSWGRKLQRVALFGVRHAASAGAAVQRTVRTTIAPKGKALLKASVATGRAGWHHLTRTTIPQVRKQLEPVLGELGRRSTSAAQSVASAVQRRRQQLPAQPGSTTAQPAADASILGKDLYTVRHYTEARLARWRFPTFALPSFRRSLRVGSLPRFEQLFEPRNRPRVYVAIALVLLIILVVNIYVLRSKQRLSAASAQAATAVVELSRRFDDLKLRSALANESAPPSSEVATLLSELDRIESSHAGLAAAAELRESLEASLDATTHTVRVRSPRRVVTFPAVNRIARLGSDVVALSRETNVLRSSPIAGELIDGRSALPGGERASLAVMLGSTDGLLVVKQSGQVYRLPAPGEQPIQLSVEGDGWQSAVDGRMFADTLYLLDPAGNEIRKYPTKEGGFSGASNYVKDGTNVSDGIALAIDGSIFVLKSDGTILKFTRGKRDGFSVRELPDGVSLADGRALSTDETSPSIYVLTQTAVVELGKTGLYLRRYVSADWTNLKSLVVDSTTKQAWVLNDTTVYELSLQ